MQKSHAYAAIGLMSGTSLDGLDIAYCHFNFLNGKWVFELLHHRFIPYPKQWKEKLSAAFYCQTNELQFLDMEFGAFLAEHTHQFIVNHQLKPDLIASHGHTVFHQPEQGITIQIGNATLIAQKTGILTISNFRQADVNKGGQGAPLVPVGDKHLFSDYGICLNIGGIANISFDENGKRLAFDVCPANQVLNIIAQKEGFDFDRNGMLAQSGKVNHELLQQLNSFTYYHSPFPKSLGREWIENQFIPTLNAFHLHNADAARTVVEHIAMQVQKATKNIPPSKVLVTGGGAFNAFLVSRIAALNHHQVVVPSPEIVSFKEAIVFAFLGVLRLRGEINCLASVTGASEDSSTGDLHYFS